MHMREQYAIRARGTALTRFLQAVRAAGLLCKGQHCTGTTFHCRIHAGDLAEIKRLAAHFSIELECEALPSLAGKIRRHRLRIGIPIGLFCAVSLIFWLSNSVTVIEIQGRTNVSEAAILAMLEQEGVRRGSWIPDIDVRRCEQQLRMHVPGIAWAGIRHTGSRLVVEISESTPVLPPLNERLPCNIVSLYDAQITDVTVYNGHLQRMIGDGVSAGELLVSGVWETPYGETKYHHALASVCGIYEKEAELSEYFTITETEQTGRTHRRNVLQLFHIQIPLGTGTPDYAEYDSTEAEVPLSILGFPLPVSLIQQRWTETETRIHQRTEEETRLALNGALVRYEKNFLADVTILERRTTFTSDENGMTCHVTYRVEGEIGTSSEIFLK